MATNIINGTTGNDVIVAHEDAAYGAGQLSFVLGGMPAQGGWPSVNILVNGVVVDANLVITSPVLQGQTQVVTVQLPTTGPVTSIGIQYTNDLVTSVDDRNVYVGSVTLNGHDIALASGTYVRNDFPTIAGQNDMDWNGTMTWSGAVVSSALSGGSTANNDVINGQGGTDTVLYQGRQSAYSVGYSSTGLSVTPHNGAFATDQISHVANVLFDDRGAYGAGGAAAVDPNAGTIDGGSGIDTLVLQGSRSQYTISHTSTGFSIAGNGVNEWVTNVERLEFADSYVALDITGDGGMAYRLYQAAFDRQPDLPGLGYQMSAMDNGLGIAQVAGNFIASPEFQATYGQLDDTQFVTQLYHNVLHRDPDAGGLAYHVNNLEHNGYARADVLVGFSESPENQANVIGSIQDGMVYTL